MQVVELWSIELKDAVSHVSQMIASEFPNGTGEGEHHAAVNTGYQLQEVNRLEWMNLQSGTVTLP